MGDDCCASSAPPEWLTALRIAVMSVATSFVVPCEYMSAFFPASIARLKRLQADIMFTEHNHTAEALTAAWMLPVGSSPPSALDHI